MSAYDDHDSLAFRFLEGGLRSLKRYLQHEVVGLDSIPSDGGALVVSHHSLATYDSMLLGVEVADQLDRELLAMVDRLVFAIPATRVIFQEIAIVGTRENATRTLAQGKLVLTVPGGMRESLRNRHRRYQIDWSGRYGFIKVAMRAGVPIVLAACPAADDIYEVYPSRLTQTLYDRLRFPVPLFRGRGPTWIPRPIKLTHLLSEPLSADVAPDQITDRDVEAFHTRVVARMQELMLEAQEFSVHGRGEPTKVENARRSAAKASRSDASRS